MSNHTIASATEKYSRINPIDTYPLAKQAIIIPEMEGYLNSSALLQGLVSSLNPTQGLTLVKSIPAITTHTLIPPDGTLWHKRNYHPMCCQLLSEDLESQTNLFMVLKNNDEHSTTIL